MARFLVVLVALGALHAAAAAVVAAKSGARAAGGAKTGSKADGKADGKAAGAGNAKNTKKAGSKVDATAVGGARSNKEQQKAQQKAQKAQQEQKKNHKQKEQRAIMRKEGHVLTPDDSDEKPAELHSNFVSLDSTESAQTENTNQGAESTATEVSVQNVAEDSQQEGADQAQESVAQAAAGGEVAATVDAGTADAGTADAAQAAAEESEETGQAAEQGTEQAAEQAAEQGAGQSADQATEQGDEQVAEHRAEQGAEAAQEQGAAAEAAEGSEGDAGSAPAQEAVQVTDAEGTAQGTAQGVSAGAGAAKSSAKSKAKEMQHGSAGTSTGSISSRLASKMEMMGLLTSPLAMDRASQNTSLSKKDVQRIQAEANKADAVHLARYANHALGAFASEDGQDAALATLTSSKCGLKETSKPRPSVFVAVMTSPGAFEKRAAIRRTWAGWGEDGWHKTVRFVMCKGNLTKTQLAPLFSEDKWTKDLVMVDCIESPSLMSLKTRAALQMFTQKCDLHKFFFKVEDDTYLSWKRVRQMLESASNKPVYIGNIFQGFFNWGGCGYGLDAMTAQAIMTNQETSGDQDQMHPEDVTTGNLVKAVGGVNFVKFQCDRLGFGCNDRNQTIDNFVSFHHIKNPALMDCMSAIEQTEQRVFRNGDCWDLVPRDLHDNEKPHCRLRELGNFGD